MAKNKYIYIYTYIKELASHSAAKLPDFSVASLYIVKAPDTADPGTLSQWCSCFLLPSPSSELHLPGSVHNKSLSLMTITNPK